MNTKHKILETLFSSNNSLTRDDIAWAVENIPDNESSREPIPFDHDKQHVYEACGLTDDDLKEVANEYRKIKMSKDHDKKSNLVEDIVSTGSSKLIRSLLIKGVMQVESDVTDSLKEVLDLIKKMK